jgi:hypothetical protein
LSADFNRHFTFGSDSKNAVTLIIQNKKITCIVEGKKRRLCGRCSAEWEDYQ